MCRIYYYVSERYKKKSLVQLKYIGDDRFRYLGSCENGESCGKQMEYIPDP